ncbi:MAG: hypothetical protein SV186_02275 [Candidatus Nanohaloarchaea archaeon]|nr:hypothetical protein [Candidatus Nanohaloarchaea archaeon]
MQERTWTSGDATVTVTGKDRIQGYHRVEIDGDNTYNINFWKDGAFSVGRKGYKLKSNDNPGIYLDLETDEGDGFREQIEPGKSAETSHYADLRDMDDATVEAAEETVNDYLEQQDDHEALDAVNDFFDDVKDGRL